MFAENGIAG